MVCIYKCTYIVPLGISVERGVIKLCFQTYKKIFAIYIFSLYLCRCNNQLNIKIMTKNEIISELLSMDARSIASLSILFYNRATCDRYVFNYNCSKDVSFDDCFELFSVMKVLNDLRDCVISVNVVYNTHDYVDGPVRRFWSCYKYKNTISDFIKSIKKK